MPRVFVCPHRTVSPAPRRPVIIVIILTSTALAWGGMDPNILVQLLASVLLLSVGSVVTLRFVRRAPLPLSRV